MRNKVVVVSVLTLLVASGWWLTSRGRAGAAKPSAPRAERQKVELTVYAQDFAMVREVRPMQLTKGRNRLRVLDVSKQLDPKSVLLRWQGGEDAAAPHQRERGVPAPQNLPQLVAHAYDLGVANGDGLLKRYLGKEVELVRYGEDGREAERQTGTLIVEADGEVVVQTDGKFYVRPQGTIVAPTNGDIVTIPQLTVQAESSAAQSTNLEVAYLTRGLSWSADYVATLSPQNSTLALECWATVTNRTGADYPNAKVSLIAGTPNRAARTAPPGTVATGLPAEGFFHADGLAELKARYKAPNIEGGQPEAVGDFHAYHIAKPTTVVQEQMNRLLMLSSENVPVLKDYSARLPHLSAWDYYYDWGTPNQPKRGNVQVALTFFNKEKDGLGAPLPQGSIRIYEPDKSGSLRYAGAATIPNTPKDQKVNITLARAFDVFTEYRIAKTQKVSKRTVRKQVEVVLHNEKATPIDLRVVQGFDGRWKIVSESHKRVNLDAYNAQWTVNVPVGEKVTLSYGVDLTG